MLLSNHTSFRVLFDKSAPYALFEKYIYILAVKMASPGNQHCADCIGTLSFPVRSCGLIKLFARWHICMKLPLSCRYSSLAEFSPLRTPPQLKGKSLLTPISIPLCLLCAPHLFTPGIHSYILLLVQQLTKRNFAIELK